MPRSRSGRCSRPTYRGRAERLPAGEHRQLRDDVHLPHVHPGVELRRGFRRPARAKIFFTIAGAFVYLYLFLSVPGSFDIELGNLSDNPVSVAIILVGGVLLLVAVARMFWKRSRASGSGRKTEPRSSATRGSTSRASSSWSSSGGPRSSRSSASSRRAPPFQGGAPPCPPNTPFAGTFRGRDEFDKRSRGTAEVLRGAVLDNKDPRFPEIFSLAKPSDGLEPSTPSLPWRFRSAGEGRANSACFAGFPCYCGTSSASRTPPSESPERPSTSSNLSPQPVPSSVGRRGRVPAVAWVSPLMAEAHRET
jgi:hypothetical protein